MNIKKLFPDKKGTKKRMLEFLDKKGFYIVLILCIGIVGATAVFVTTHNISSPDSSFDAQKIIPEDLNNNPASSVSGNGDVQPTAKTTSTLPEKTDVKIKATEPVKPTVPKSSKQTEQKTGNNQTSGSGEKSTQTKTTVSGKTEKFIMPVYGEVSLEFASDKLIYSKTLDEWKTHSGLDISGDRGTPVKSVASGFVSDIKSDPRLGVTIIIEHPNGLKTVYANLASDNMVSPNQKITAGDVIGCIGNTATFESAEQSHLHFEVLKNDDPVNPETYLPKK